MWARVVKAAVAATGREGKPIGYAEIVRRAIDAYLAAQKVERTP